MFVINIFLFVLKWVLIILSPFIVSLIFFYLKAILQGRRRKKGSYKYVGYGSKIKRLFYDMPKQIVDDFFSNDPDKFKEYGVHIIAGEQGCGKSITLTYMLMRYKKMYPKLNIKTNYNFAFQNGEINHWRDLVSSNNGIYGEIDVIDEIQNWFNSLQSKDFPPEMMQEITQQRKQIKCIFGTSQVFNRVAKPIREQTTFLYEPRTFFGCLTIVNKYKPVVLQDGSMDKKIPQGVFFFVHNAELRQAYDTYKKIETLCKSGFKKDSERLTNNALNNM